ncbi:MAG TPA: Flp pilus assembly protein CpaB [Candidatus Nanoarchaeia archaeon]|nr:Flp pilus assembly protein CpaB [Candidatus Nanoarchaeia archaeon]
MDNRRIVIALLIALVVSGGATFLIYSRIRKAREARGDTFKVVAAKDQLRAGTQLSADNVALIEWPNTLPLKDSFSKVEDVVGRPVLIPVAANQPILASSVALAGSGLGLTVRIPEGMRAVSVRSNDVVGVAGFLYPGSHVDVLVTYRPPEQNEQITRTVLQNVEVASAGQKIEPDPQGKPETVHVVTLLLSPIDSEKLLLAEALGNIQFVLRNGVDAGTAQTPGISASELGSGVKPKPPRRTPIAAKTVKLPEFYAVETITGGKRLVDKFEQPKE